MATSKRVAALSAVVAGASLIGNAVAQSGPYTVSDATTTRTYTVTQGRSTVLSFACSVTGLTH